MPKQQAQPQLNDNQDLQTIRNLYEELPQFKDRIEKTRETVSCTLNENYNEREIEILKQANVTLYKKFKNDNPNKEVCLSKSHKLNEYESLLKTKKEAIEREVDGKLSEIKQKMHAATTKFIDRMEHAILDMQKSLSESKVQLTSVEEFAKSADNLHLYGEIKNILLLHKNLLMTEITKPTVAEVSPNTSTISNNLSTNVNKSNKVTVEKVLNININKDVNKDFEERTPNKIVIFYAPEDKDDKAKAREILSKLTELNLENIEAYRLGKIGDKPRPMIVVFDDVKYVNEVLNNRFSLKDTEFKGVKIVKYSKEKTNKNLLKNKEADKANPLCIDLSDASDTDETQAVAWEDKPHKIVLYYVPEDGNDHQIAMSILKELTKLPLKNIEVGRIGNKSDVKIRPMIIAFDSQRYVCDALTNRYSLKDTPFKGTKIVKFKKITSVNEAKSTASPF